MTDENGWFDPPLTRPPMTKIDDEMVQRAWNAYKNSTGSCTQAMKAAIDAALSPKHEPEIEVTEGMKGAGKRVVERRFHPSSANGDVASEVYRAMESTRLKEAQERDYKRAQECKACNGTGNAIVGGGRANLICP